MRELKFRAWIKSYKHDSNVPISRRTDFGFPKMVMPMCVHSEHGFEYREGLSVRQIFRREYDFELMQYTGLKDVNGVEIYEGDIIKTDWGNGEVKFRNSCFGVFNQKSSLISLLQGLFISMKSVEVVGNRFENPELLKEEEG